MANYYDGFDVRPFTLWLVVATASQNVTANTSVVSYSLRIRKDGNSTPFNSDTSPWGVTIDGQNFTGNVAYNFSSMSVGSYAVIASGNKTVSHNADGSKTINVSANFNDSSGLLDFATLAGTYALATIPRVSEPTLSDSDVNIGDTITIFAHRQSASFNHTITYSFGGASGTIVTNSSGSPTPNTGDYDWTVPTSLYAQLPNTTSGTGTITVTTLNGGVALGSRTVSFTARVPTSVVPTFNFVAPTNVSEGNPAVTTAAIGAYVQNVSKVTASMGSPAAGTGASIATATITVAGQTINATSGTTPAAIATSGASTPVVATLTDSRGRVTSKTVNINVLAYAYPQIVTMSAQRTNAGGTPVSNGEYVKITLNANTSSLVVGTQKNNMTIKTFARVRGTTDWGTERNSVVDADLTYNGSYVVSTTAGLFDDEVAYDFKVEVTDKFNIASQERAVTTAGITMHWSNSGGVGVGKFWSQGALDVEGTIHSGELRLASTGGASLSSTLHAFQIGASSSLNLIADQNEIQARNNGAASTLTLNGNGGGVVIGNSASNNSVPGNLIVDQSIYVESSIVGRQGTGHLLFQAATDDGSSISDLQFLNDGTLRTRAGGASGQYRSFPFATAAGRSTISATGTTTITFPASRFTQAPRVTAQVVESGGVVAVVWISTDPTTTNFVARVYTLGGVQRAGTIEWQAVQMTPTAASG